MIHIKAIPTVQIDSERVRVTEWRFPPGAETGFHVHEMDYVVVPTKAGQLTMVDEKGGFLHSSTLMVGQSYERIAGVAHNVVNNSSLEVSFIEVEFK